MTPEKAALGAKHRHSPGVDEPCAKLKGADAPDRPFSAMDSPDPEALWRRMDATRAQGHDLLALPDNSNGSDGEMFATRRFDEAATSDACAALRARSEKAPRCLLSSPRRG